MNYLTGDPLFLNFVQTTTPQATPAPNLAAFPTVSGAARCRKSRFLTQLSWTVTPTPIRVSDLKLPQSLPLNDIFCQLFSAAQIVTLVMWLTRLPSSLVLMESINHKPGFDKSLNLKKYFLTKIVKFLKKIGYKIYCHQLSSDSVLTAIKISNVNVLRFCRIKFDPE